MPASVSAVAAPDAPGPGGPVGAEAAPLRAVASLMCSGLEG